MCSRCSQSAPRVSKVLQTCSATAPNTPKCSRSAPKVLPKCRRPCGARSVHFWSTLASLEQLWTTLGALYHSRSTLGALFEHSSKHPPEAFSEHFLGTKKTCENPGWSRLGPRQHMTVGQNRLRVALMRHGHRGLRTGLAVGWVPSFGWLSGRQRS